MSETMPKSPEVGGDIVSSGPQSTPNSGISLEAIGDTLEAIGNLSLPQENASESRGGDGRSSNSSAARSIDSEINTSLELNTEPEKSEKIMVAKLTTHFKGQIQFLEKQIKKEKDPSELTGLLAQLRKLNKTIQSLGEKSLEYITSIYKLIFSQKKD